MSEQKEEFWTSKEGILIRLEDLAHDFTFKVYNGATKAYFEDAGFKRFRWVTAVGRWTCKYCLNQNGREYKSGQFIPRIPVHIKCNCFWDILVTL